MGIEAAGSVLASGAAAQNGAQLGSRMLW